MKRSMCMLKNLTSSMNHADNKANQLKKDPGKKLTYSINQDFYPYPLSRVMK
jgi:hypothetical protein